MAVEFGDGAFHHVEDRLIERHIHHLPAPVVVRAVIKRHQDPDHTVQRRQGVADADPRANRRLAGHPRDVPQTAHRLGDDAEPSQVSHRAGLAVARDAQHDQPRVELGQGLVIEPPLLQRAGAKVLNHDVGLGGQLSHQGLAFGLAQVDGHRLLVSRLDMPPHGGHALGRTPGTQRIAGAGGFDLDHFCAEVGQRLGRERACDQGAQFDDANAGQGPLIGFGVHVACLLRCLPGSGAP